jgi:protein-S-isoprenylcysteine O-methyltransferase Ste14
MIGALMWWAQSLVPLVEIPAAVRIAAAAAIVLVAVVFDLAGLYAFRRARTSINPLHPARASALVVTGIYRVTRNPMYVGLLLMLVAWTVYLSSLWLIAGPLVFILYMNHFQIAPEERVLSVLFPEEYEAYCRRVRRWL